MASSTTTSKLELSRQLELEAQAIHLDAQKANKEGRFDDAKALYTKMNEVDNESLRLACEAVSESPASPSLTPSLPAFRGPRWSELVGRGNYINGTTAELRDRAKGAILGSLLGDASASGVQWIYNLDDLKRIDTEMRGGTGDITFMDPPQSSYLPPPVYKRGDLSPYGEQTYALLKSAATSGGLSATNYAQQNFLHFSSTEQAIRYRDAATKGFLRNYAQGLAVPGADDFQANCATRTCVTAVMAAGSGPDKYLSTVESVIRVTQNTDKAVAYAHAASFVLELVLRGVGPLEALVESIPALRRHAYVHDGSDDARAALYRDIAHQMDQVVQSYGVLDVPEFCLKYGRNCHMPNSLQSPLFAAVYSVRQGGSAEEIFKRGVQLAVREGGCCASRASITGAVLGAYVGAKKLPADWKALAGNWAEYERLAEQAVSARD